MAAIMIVAATIIMIVKKLQKISLNKGKWSNKRFDIGDNIMYISTIIASIVAVIFATFMVFVIYHNSNVYIVNLYTEQQKIENEYSYINNVSDKLNINYSKYFGDINEWNTDVINKKRCYKLPWQRWFYSKKVLDLKVFDLSKINTSNNKNTLTIIYCE